MKILRFPFALLIAVLAIIVTISTKANFAGKATLTACFSTNIRLQNAAATIIRPIIANSTDCSITISYFSAGVKYLGAKPATPISIMLSTEDVDFCCAKFRQLDKPETYPDVPWINIGGKVAKWEIADVLDIYCRD